MFKSLLPVIVTNLVLYVFWLSLFASIDFMHVYVIYGVWGVSVGFLMLTSRFIPFLLNCKSAVKFASETTSETSVKNIEYTEAKIQEVAVTYGMRSPRFLISIGDRQTNSLAIDGLVTGPAIIFTQRAMKKLSRQEIDLMVEFHMHNIYSGDVYLATFSSSLVSFFNIVLTLLTFGLLRIGSYEDFKPNTIIYALSYITTIPFAGVLRLMQPVTYQIDADAFGIVKGRYVSGGSELLEKIASDREISRCEAIPLFAVLYYHNPLKRKYLHKRADAVYYDRLNNIFFCQALVRNYLSKRLGLDDLGVDVSRAKVGAKSTETIEFVDSRALQRRMRLDMFKRSLKDSEAVPKKGVYSGKKSLDIVSRTKADGSSLPWATGGGSRGSYKFIERVENIDTQKRKFEDYKMNNRDVENVIQEFQDKKYMLKAAKGNN